MKRLFLLVLFCILFISFSSAEQLNFSINTNLNSLTSVFLTRTNDLSTNQLDNFDAIRQTPSTNWTSLHASIGVSNLLSIDSWNITESPRTINLTLQISPARSGVLNLSWNNNTITQGFRITFQDFNASSTWTTPITSTLDMSTFYNYTVTLPNAISNRYFQLYITTSTPVITVHNPINGLQTKENNQIYNMSVSDSNSVDKRWYTLDNGITNITFDGDEVINRPDGSHNVKFCANYTTGSSACSNTVSYSILGEDEVYGGGAGAGGGTPSTGTIRLSDLQVTTNSTWYYDYYNEVKVTVLDISGLPVDGIVPKISIFKEKVDSKTLKRISEGIYQQSFKLSSAENDTIILQILAEDNGKTIVRNMTISILPIPEELKFKNQINAKLNNLITNVFLFFKSYWWQILVSLMILLVIIWIISSSDDKK